MAAMGFFNHDGTQCRGAAMTGHRTVSNCVESPMSRSLTTRYPASHSQNSR